MVVGAMRSFPRSAVNACGFSEKSSRAGAGDYEGLEEQGDNSKAHGGDLADEGFGTG